MDPEQVRQIALQAIQEYMHNSQFTTGPIPVHHHTGVANDAPKLPFIGLSDTPTSYEGQSGKVATVNSTENALVFEEVVVPTFNLTVDDTSTFVSNVSTISFTSGATVTDAGGGEVDVDITGGGGASPGGSDRDIQFNNSGSFGGDDGFKYEVFGPGTGGPAIVGQDGFEINSSFALMIDTGTIPTVPINSADIVIVPGDDGSGHIGTLRLFGGTKSSGSNRQTGTIRLIGSGTGGGSLGTSPIVQLYGTDYVTTSLQGRIELDAGQDANGNLAAITLAGFVDILEIAVSFGGDAAAQTVTSNATGTCLFIKNISSAPTSSVTGFGILYVQAGALKYRGTAGTVTTIANA